MAKNPPVKPATKQPTNKANKQPSKQATPPIQDDFDDYRLWVGQAVTSTARPSSLELRNDWDQLPDDHGRAFTEAVRAFWEAKRGQVAADVELRKAASVFPHIRELKDSDRITRSSLRDARDHKKCLDEALKGRQAAVLESISRLGALEELLTATPDARLRWYFEDHQRELKESLEEEREFCDDFVEASEQIVLDDDVTSGLIKILKDFAADILEHLSEPKSFSSSAGSDASSSSKRKRSDEAGNASSKIMRATGDAHVPPIKSVQPGAEQRPQQPSGLNARATSKQLHVSGAANVPRSKSAHPGAEPPQQQPSVADADHGPRSHGRPAEQPAPTLQDLFLPLTGSAGYHVHWLRTHLDELTPSFISWCRPQLVNAGCRTMKDAEPLAQAFCKYYEETLPDHDWENEGPVPFLPFHEDAFRKHFPGGRHWPNVRRLLAMTRDASEELQEYAIRHVFIKGRLYEYANHNAAHVIVAIQRRDPQNDWNMENDRLEIKPSIDMTSKIPLEGLDGHWNFREVAGKGGNGRALLYTKNDSAGNILQRVISKESFIGKDWNSSSQWYKRPADRIPIEAGLHSLLPKNRHILEYLGYHVHKQLRMVRIYSVFMELGDLHELFENHKSLENVVDHEGYRLKAPPIPVVAIFYIFEAMAAGACLMAYGTLPHDDGVWPDGHVVPPLWDHNIVHRDIKPLNYFLSSTSSSSAVWPGLPVVALGDFGNAFDATDHAFILDPHRTRGAGTPLWQAPEQQTKGPMYASVTWATNVYQIGLSILQLMTLEMPAFEVTFDEPNGDEIFPDPEAQFYPEALIKLAWSCIKPNPANRPRPEVLYMEIRKMAMSFPVEGSHQLPWQFQHVPADQRVRTKADKYAAQWLA